MKQINSNDNALMSTVKNNINKTCNRNIIRSKKAQAKVRRQEAKNWAVVAEGKKYQVSSAKELSRQATAKMKDEFFDSYGITLNDRHENMSHNAKMRLLRRIVEKRQAQTVAKAMHKRGGKFKAHMMHTCISKSIKAMNNLYEKIA